MATSMNTDEEKPLTSVHFPSRSIFYLT